MIALCSMPRRAEKRKDALRPDTLRRAARAAGVKKNRTHWTAFFLRPVSTLAGYSIGKEPLLAAARRGEPLQPRGAAERRLMCMTNNHAHLSTFVENLERLVIAYCVAGDAHITSLATGR